MGVGLVGEQVGSTHRTNQQTPEAVLMTISPSRSNGWTSAPGGCRTRVGERFRSGWLNWTRANCSISTLDGRKSGRSQIVRALFDTLDGYTEDEKVVIGRDHLLPRQRDRAGLSAADVVDEALRVIAAEHTREAGVRQLERAIARVLRKVTVALVGGAATPVRVSAGELARYLGRPRFVPETAERTRCPAWPPGLRSLTPAGMCSMSRPPRWTANRD